MDRQRFLSAALAAMTCGAVLAPAAVQAGQNNLNIRSNQGVKLGIAKASGKALTVKLERTSPLIRPAQNDSYLQIIDVPAGADVTPPYGGQTFAEAFPNGAFELVDLGWGPGFRDRDLYAWKNCLQVQDSAGTGYDRTRVYCDKTNVTKIKISSGEGSDVVLVDPAITVPVTHPCGHRRTRCGVLTCLESTPYTCCDAVAGLDGCIDQSGGTCEVDPEAPMVWCPQF